MGPVRGQLAYRECSTCGSGYVPEPPIAFRDYYQGYDPTLVADLPAVLVRRYSAMLERLEGWVPRRALLEVGCGNGHFLTVARERGWEVSGIELSRPHVDRARAMGLDVRYGDLAGDQLFADRSFGAAVMIEVIEHVPEPRTLLAGCHSRLDPGGVLFLTTPNYGSLTRRLLGHRWSVLSHEHVALASSEGLRLALRDTGYEPLRLRSKNLFVGEYRKLFASSDVRDATSLSHENVRLRDRIEESVTLSALKSVVNVALGVTGLGEGTECWARRSGGSHGSS
jgi:SAM-dependent methyltransferase